MLKRKICMLLFFSFLGFALSACSSNPTTVESAITDETQTQSSEESLENETEKESSMQDKEDKNNMPTRRIEGGTKINIYFGDTMIPGILNESAAARDLIKRLPYIMHASRYEFDICGVMDYPLNYDESELVEGWHNGDISFTTSGNYFTILFGYEEDSGGKFANLGVVDCPLEDIKALNGSFDVYIKLAEP